jgi:V/A-type H+-transporting ATPase subunit I
MGFNPVQFTESMRKMAGEGDRVSDLLNAIGREIEEKKKEVEHLDTECQRFLVHQEKLMVVYDVLNSRKHMLLSTSRLGQTDKLVYLEGWIRSRDKSLLEATLKPYEETTEVYFRPPLPEEEPPSILENPKSGRPFELLTTLYGLPKRGTMDPTLPLAPFFFLFVGLCVSEAGYGILVLLASLLFLKFGKPKGGLRQFLQLLVYLAIATVVCGTLIGGWFGFPIKPLMVIDPLEDPFSFLILALALGFIQVWFGTLLKLIQGIKNKRYLEAVFVQGGWLVLLPSLVLLFLVKQPVWKFTSLAGAAGIVFFAAPSRNPLARFFGGLYSLYDISRYLADILSYSRLLALGLATTVIAMVVNTLCQTVIGIPVLGWVFAALIFVGGHLFNLGISFLGGFVHSMRLQFVEFFSKFFVSGGRPFEPFELESKYVEFT